MWEGGRVRGREGKDEGGREGKREGKMEKGYEAGREGGRTMVLRVITLHSISYLYISTGRMGWSGTSHNLIIITIIIRRGKVRGR